MKYNDFQRDKLRDDPDNYRMVFFYFNSEDSRVLVPRRFRNSGWTFNFANPYTYLILIGIILFIGLVTVFA